MSRRKTPQEIERERYAKQMERRDEAYLQALRNEVEIMELIVRRAHAAVDIESRRVKRGIAIINKKEKMAHEQQKNSSK
jgi:hypothetical protein